MAMPLPLNQILVGECSEIMSQWPADSIDLTVTSPPYGKIRDYKGFVFPFKKIARQLYRITKPGGVVVWVTADQTIKGSESGESFRQALRFKKLGFNLHDTMIWLKSGVAFRDANRYGAAFDYMFVLSKGRPKTFNPIKDKRNKRAGIDKNWTKRNRSGDIVGIYGSKKFRKIPYFGVRYNHWIISNASRGFWSKHPSTFPEQLAHDHIVSWSNPGDIVLDPMCGSGTTLKAAKLLQRKFVGIEIAEEYARIARRRIL